MAISAVARTWYKKILRGTATLSNVPPKWHDEVLSLLDEALAKGEITQEQYNEYIQ